MNKLFNKFKRKKKDKAYIVVDMRKMDAVSLKGSLDQAKEAIARQVDERKIYFESNAKATEFVIIETKEVCYHVPGKEHETEFVRMEV